MYKKKFSLLVVESVSMETTATGHFPSSNWQNSEGKMIPSVCESVGEIDPLLLCWWDNVWVSGLCESEEEGSLAIAIKISNACPFWPSNALLGIHLTEILGHMWDYNCIQSYSSFIIANNWKQPTPSNKGLVNKIMVHPQDGMPQSRETIKGKDSVFNILHFVSKESRLRMYILICLDVQKKCWKDT